MNPEQLWKTTMDPTRLLRVPINAGIQADRVFAILMRDEVEKPRVFN